MNSEDDHREWRDALDLLDELQVAFDGGTRWFDKGGSFEVFESTLRECRRKYRFIRWGDGRTWGSAQFGIIPPLCQFKGRDPQNGSIVLQNTPDLEGIAAEFVIRYADNDYQFFEEIARVLAIRGKKRGGKRGLPMKARLIEAADRLCRSLGRNPTREELKEEAERLNIEVGDWTKTLKDCKLGFLEGRRGRPRKIPG